MADEDAVPDSEKYINSSVYARDLEWLPLEGQAERFGEQGPCTVHPNILVAKLRPGQEIDLVLKVSKTSVLCTPSGRQSARQATGSCPQCGC